MHPKNIFPDCKSVISIVQPIPRSSYRGITEGTHWSNYTYYSYNRLNTLFRPILTDEISRFIEEHGFEAVPVYPGVPESYPNNPNPIPGRPAPDVNLNIRIAAMACGLGEIGWSKVFLRPVFRATCAHRKHLDRTPYSNPIHRSSLRDTLQALHEMRTDCPATQSRQRMVPSLKSISMDRYTWGDVNMGDTTATTMGSTTRFLHVPQKYFGIQPRLKTTMSEELAYKITHNLGLANWHRANPEFPAINPTPTSSRFLHVGYLALCGAKGAHQASHGFRKRAKTSSRTPSRPQSFRSKWELCPREDPTGGIVERNS